MNTVAEYEQVLPALENVLRRRVCSICANRNPDGSCDLDARRECMLFERLPSIAEAISRIRSEDMEPYVAAIRETVCAECFHQRLDGSCPVREELRCALDRHMVPVVWAIESGLAATEETTRESQARAPQRLTVMER
jgi:hypothetical protein